MTKDPVIPRFKIGDIIESQGLQRQIVEVRDTGYSWKYPHDSDRCPNGQENLFWSENSNDPFFEIQWKLANKVSAQ